MLAVTGHPVATNPSRRLGRVAKSRRWPIIMLHGSAQNGGSNHFPPFLESDLHGQDTTVNSNI